MICYIAEPQWTDVRQSCSPWEPRSWPICSPARWTNRQGTLSEPPLSCPATLRPELYGRGPGDKTRGGYVISYSSWSHWLDKTNKWAVCLLICRSYLGPQRHQPAGHLSIPQCLFMLFQGGVDLGAVAEQYVVCGSWAEKQGGQWVTELLSGTWKG